MFGTTRRFIRALEQMGFCHNYIHWLAERAKCCVDSKLFSIWSQIVSRRIRLKKTLFSPEFIAELGPGDGGPGDGGQGDRGLSGLGGIGEYVN